MAADAHVAILAMVTNFREGWRTDELHARLANPAARGNLIDNIYSNLLEHRFAGVNVDFEGLRVEDRERMNALMRELRAKLEPAGLLVTQSVPANDRAYDLKTLAALNDLLVIMLYDEHSTAGEPGPVGAVGGVQGRRARLPPRAA